MKKIIAVALVLVLTICSVALAGGNDNYDLAEAVEYLWRKTDCHVYGNYTVEGEYEYFNFYVKESDRMFFVEVEDKSANEEDLQRIIGRIRESYLEATACMSFEETVAYVNQKIDVITLNGALGKITDEGTLYFDLWVPEADTTFFVEAFRLNGEIVALKSKVEAVTSKIVVALGK